MLIALWVCQGCGVDRETEREARPTAGRKHRVIFNGDSAALLYPHANTVEGFLTPRFRPLLGTPVTTISWCIYAGAPLYDSRIQPRFIDVHQEPPQDHEQYLPNLKALIESGNCPLKILTEFAHENGMEAFASIRMNDVHDSFWRGLLGPWKKENPQYLVSDRKLQTSESLAQPTFPGSPIANLYVTAQDFSHQAVRDRKAEVIQELCNRYDIDGVELDFIRHPVLFKSIFEGKAISPQETEMMTSFIRRLRGILDEAGSKRGRPILLSARVPETIRLSAGIGLDLKGWMEEDLLDILIPGGGYSPFSMPANELVDLAHRYGVPACPCINVPPLVTASRERLMEAVRALALKWHAAGGDGLYFWNMGSNFASLYHDEQAWRAMRREYYACLDGLGDPEALARGRRLYLTDLPVFFPYVFISSDSGLPVRLEEGRGQEISILTGEGEVAAGLGSSPPAAELTLTLEGPVTPSRLSVELNGMALTGGRSDPAPQEDTKLRISYDVKPSSVQLENRIQVSLASPVRDEVRLHQIELLIEGNSKSP